MARHANGTGPFKLESREVDVKTVFVENPNWWNKANKTGNVTRIEYTPISSNATRTAALLSGQVDLVIDPPTQDIARLERNSDITVRTGSENRVVLITLDQFTDKPLFVTVPGKDKVNPFKDKRVRQALYEAIDINAIQRAVMRGKSVPTGTIIAQSVNGWTPELAKRFPYDPEHAKKLLAEAGYPDGFSFTIDTPNNRWINDEAITKAIASMWTKIGLNVSASTRCRVHNFSQKFCHSIPLPTSWLGVSTLLTDSMGFRAYLKPLMPRPAPDLPTSAASATRELTSSLPKLKLRPMRLNGRLT